MFLVLDFCAIIILRKNTRDDNTIVLFHHPRLPIFYHSDWNPFIISLQLSVMAEMSLTSV